MKKLNYILAAALTVAVGSAFTSVAIAHEGAGPGHKHGTDAAASESLPGLWQQINAGHKELTDFVAAKQFDKIDGPAHSLPPLLVELGKHKDVPADKQKQVHGMANNAIKALEGLHQAGHDKKEAELQSKFKSYEAVMKALKAQFPADVAGGA